MPPFAPARLQKKARTETKGLSASTIKDTTKAKSKSQPSRSTKGKSKAIEPEELPTTFKVVAGSYEKLLYGLEGSTSLNDEDKVEFHLKPLFIFPAHVSCIKAVAASPHGGKWLATGSADEIIKVWDLVRKKEIGGLMQHEGSITQLVFPSRSHLLSASEDGTICLFRARDWSVLRSLRGHKKRVNSIAIHPSGKLAISVGQDRTMRLWDLMRGKGCASTKLGKEGEIVRWSTKGNMFVVQSGSTIDLYDSAMDLLYTVTHPSRLHDAVFYQRPSDEHEFLLVGAEDKKVSIYDITAAKPEQPPKIVAVLVGHSNRVKEIKILQIALPNSASTTIAATVSSDGKIHIYDLGSISNSPSTEVSTILPVTVYDTKGTRLTCVTLADGVIPVKTATGKRSRPDNDDNDDDEEAEETVEMYPQLEETEDEDEDEQENEQED